MAGIEEDEKKEIASGSSRKIASHDEELMQGVTRVYRDAPPSHFTFKIEAFSLLSETMEKYMSSEFEAGGYKWRLLLYPKGNDVEGYISLYLRISDTSSLPLGWEVNISFRFFLYDQIRDKYLSVGDMGGRVKRFHPMKTEWGYSKFLALRGFKDPCNGYLLHDTCIFGAEVFVCRNTGKVEHLSMLKDPSTANFSWKIQGFSQLSYEYYYSPYFSTGDHKWRIKLYPNGASSGKDVGISVYLMFESPEPVAGQKVYSEYKIRVVDQNSGNHIEKKRSYWFDTVSGYGFHNFLGLDILKDPSRGLLVMDACIIEAEVAVLALAN